MTWPAYRDMTDEQALAWGRAELATRRAEIAAEVKVDERRKNVETRRLAIGVSDSKAFCLVWMAIVEEEKQS